MPDEPTNRQKLIAFLGGDEAPASIREQINLMSETQAQVWLEHIGQLCCPWCEGRYDSCME